MLLAIEAAAAGWAVAQGLLDKTQPEAAGKLSPPSRFITDLYVVAC